MNYALFFDIDGTLVSFKTHEIPDSTIQALTQAKENGSRVYIATGRPPIIITNLGAIAHLIDGYITTNGAFCFVGDEEVYVSALDEECLEKLMPIMGTGGLKRIWTDGYNRTNATFDYDDMDRASAVASIHTGASPFQHGIVANRWMNPKTLQYIMGHSDICVTYNTYTHLGLAEAKEEMDKIARETADERYEAWRNRRKRAIGD